MPDETPVVPTWPPPRAASVDPYGMQTGSTAATATGAALLAIGEGTTTIASALGLSASSVKVLTAGLSLQAIGNVSLTCAGFVLIGLGIVLNLASLAVRRQLVKEYENEYLAAKMKLDEYRARTAERAK